MERFDLLSTRELSRSLNLNYFVSVEAASERSRRGRECRGPLKRNVFVLAFITLFFFHNVGIGQCVAIASLR